MPSRSGAGVNCFALLSRQNDCWFQTTEHSITAATVAQWLDSFAQNLRRLTVVVLDNASVHQSKDVKRHFKRWEAQRLYVFYLPAYSPHLNIAEVLWRKLKYEWLHAKDYEDKETLCYQVWQALAACYQVWQALAACYQVWQALAAVGDALNIQFAPFRQNHQSAN